MAKKKESETPVLGEAFEYDPDFRGPVKHRGCTDVLCLCIFFGFLAGWAVIAYFAVRHGDPNKLLFPTDSEGNICGINEFKSKPYLFFFDLTTCAQPSVLISGCGTPQVCVSHCPNETFYVSVASGEGIKNKMICKNDVNIARKSVSALISEGYCASMYLKSRPVQMEKVPDDMPFMTLLMNSLVGRCLPYTDSLVLHKGVVLDKNNNTMKTETGDDLNASELEKAGSFLAKFLSVKEMGEKFLSDLELSWRIILIFLVFCMLFSLFWIFLMRFVAGVMVWCSLFTVLGFLVYACYYSSFKYMVMSKDPSTLYNGTTQHFHFGFQQNLSSFLALRETWLAFAIISGSVFLIFLLILLFLRKRLLIAIALIGEASKAVACVWTSLLFPIVPYLMQLCVFAFWLVLTLYIASTGKASFVVKETDQNSVHKNGTVCDPKTFHDPTAKCMFQSYGDSQNIFQAHTYNLFGLFWAIFFIISLGQVSLAGVFAAYYWTMNKQDVSIFIVVTGFWRCIRYHLGSVAFGSCLIAIVRMIRVALEYIDQKCKKFDNMVTRAVICCCKCCFYILEKFLRFFTKNAFIVMAVYGKNFCSSAKTAFELLTRNVVRVVVLENVTNFLLLLGKLSVVAVAAVSSYLVFSGKVNFMNDFVPNLNFNLLPVIVISFGAYVIASLFFNVYGMAVDTIFLCFLEDCERNDGSPEKPYFMSKKLMKILDKKNKFRDPDD